MDKKNKNKKIISLGIILFLVMLLVSGGSYAFWTWITATEERTNVTLTIEAPDMSATFTGYTQNVSNLIPVTSCTDETYAIKKQVNLTYENLSANAGEILGTLSVQNFASPNGTPSVTALSHLHYAVTTSDDNCTSNPLSGMSGVFKATSGNLFSGQKLAGPVPSGTTETSVTFYVWVWLDSEYSHQNVGSGVVSDPMQNISFDLVWSGEIKNDLVIHPSPNAPVLDNGMIPVKIANDGTATTVSSADPSWYNYDNKEWANAVLVKNEGTQTRTYYKNNPNITIPESDILAYYVWIPRYKYQIWTTSTGSSPQPINIEFESKTAELVLGTTVDSWRTHPAFIWDGSPVAGIWVGKFETGHSTLSSSTTTNNLNCTDENCTNADRLTIKPNVSSLRYNDVSNLFYASRSMSRSGNPFGLSLSTTDTHMMKNSEWGAVAYLSHSQYGINDEIRINNNSIYTTGCGASAENGPSTSSCEIAYGGASSYPQSTTENISGVFDMSGGTYEYVMGNYNNTVADAGFTTMPISKYYDVYYNETMDTCTIETCGGHALFETAGWYSDAQSFANASGPWFLRGGDCSFDSDAGAWFSYYLDGDSGVHYGFRSVAIVGA